MIRALTTKSAHRNGARRAAGRRTMGLSTAVHPPIPGREFKKVVIKLGRAFMSAGCIAPRCEKHEAGECQRWGKSYSCAVCRCCASALEGNCKPALYAPRTCACKKISFPRALDGFEQTNLRRNVRGAGLGSWRSHEWLAVRSREKGLGRVSDNLLWLKSFAEASQGL